MLRAAVGSDYINASFIDIRWLKYSYSYYHYRLVKMMQVCSFNILCLQGYRQRGAYIATQAPMENTVNDFWRMVWDYQSRTIVLLCRMKEDGKVKQE